ncbi:hypothetical protein SODALDRAFT_360110 [Sodiomyces alkalinus F11]|uniref:Uncharacterized protein n=1 Tax=Sodiomyces alkalinus (strain CBS 110278 / VKM F-3762 / F11) TaxID=1314773 RepID=A0A3N2PTI8_SODAK|nr:hypothetical protein SODALDRAFT_360110 [Sodiomyces alkalinus F11]ROT37820.1 hypothetical protein SODALDRAFT_360110 [Sodiomyces alkalinus F11]
MSQVEEAAELLLLLLLRKPYLQTASLLSQMLGVSCIWSQDCQLAQRKFLTREERIMHGYRDTQEGGVLGYVVALWRTTEAGNGRGTHLRPGPCTPCGTRGRYFRSNHSGRQITCAPVPDWNTNVGRRLMPEVEGGTATARSLYHCTLEQSTGLSLRYMYCRDSAWHLPLYATNDAPTPSVT